MVAIVIRILLIQFLASPGPPTSNSRILETMVSGIPFRSTHSCGLVGPNKDNVGLAAPGGCLLAKF